MKGGHLQIRLQLLWPCSAICVQHHPESICNKPPYNRAPLDNIPGQRAYDLLLQQAGNNVSPCGAPVQAAKPDAEGAGKPLTQASCACMRRDCGDVVPIAYEVKWKGNGESEVFTPYDAAELWCIVKSVFSSVDAGARACGWPHLWSKPSTIAPWVKDNSGYKIYQEASNMAME